VPWYWSDEIAQVLVSRGKIDARVASTLVARPVAFRSDTETVEDAAEQLLKDEEIPIAA
jgi:hypothetical protein